MTTFINGSNIVFTNNSEDPDIYLKPANGKNLIIDGTLEDFNDGVFETLLVTESTELRNTSDILVDQINALTTTRDDFTIELPGGNFGRSVAAEKVSGSSNYRRAVSANTFLIGTTALDGDQVFGVVDVLEGEGGPFLTQMDIEAMPMPFNICATRRYGESVAIYENDLIMTSSGTGGSDSTALYRYNNGTSEWEFERFFETSEAFACDIRQNTACTDKHIMTKSGSTWTLTNVDSGPGVNDCCCTVIGGNRVFFHALDNATLRVQGSTTTTPSIQATSIHVSDGFSFSGSSIARLVCLNGSILNIYTVSADGSLAPLQTIDLLETFDAVRITRSANLIVVVKADKARFCSFFNDSYIFQSNVVSQLSIDYPISSSKRAVALTEEKLFIASNSWPVVSAFPKCVYEYDLSTSPLSVDTAVSQLTVDSKGIQTSGPTVNISADKVGFYTTDSDSNVLRYLVVGSGGPGGFNYETFNSGGGGAGQLIEGTLKIQARDYNFNVSVGDFTISQDLPNTVGDSSILTETQSGVVITAYGGGQGAGTYPPVVGGGGGGVGSGAYPNGAFGFEYNGTTFKGGDTATVYQIPGGGAGSNGDGQQGTFGAGVGDLPYTGGLGGAGTVSNITGANITYAAGGQGAIRTDPIIQITPGVDGAANTGNGGTGGYLPGSGGSGVVIVRFPTLYFKGYTGTATLSLVGTDTVIKFTAGQGTFSLGVPAGVNVLDDLNIVGETVAQKKLTTWKDVEILDTTPINGSDATEGALRVVGGIATDGSLFVGGGVLASTLAVSGPGTFLPSAIFQGKTWVSDNTASTSASTGALVVNGGVGVGGTVYAQTAVRTQHIYPRYQSFIKFFCTRAYSTTGSASTVWNITRSGHTTSSTNGSATFTSVNWDGTTNSSSITLESKSAYYMIINVSGYALSFQETYLIYAGLNDLGNTFSKIGSTATFESVSITPSLSITSSHTYGQYIVSGSTLTFTYNQTYSPTGHNYTFTLNFIRLN